MSRERGAPIKPEAEGPTDSPTLLDALFLFPLPDIQLFPHALVPLHIFEQRYRVMTHDCLLASKQLALGTFEPGFENDYEGRPAVKPVCGMGEIVAHHLHPNGRYDILVRGTHRVRLLEELPPLGRPYRVCRAEVLSDHYRAGVDFGLARQSLLMLCDRLASALPNGGDTLRALARQEEDPAAVVDVLGAALVTDPERRQSLVELLDVAARFDAVSEVVVSVLGRLDDGSGAGSRN